MPASLSDALSDEELRAAVVYLAGLPGSAQAQEPPAPEAASGGAPEAAATSQPAAGAGTLTDEEFAWAKQTFFERCAGCHGTLRKGATGPALTPDVTIPKGVLGLAAIIFNGTTGGMPDWGKQGFFTTAETETMAEYLLIEPPMPPELSLEQMKASWKVLVPPDERPTEPQTPRNWQNYFIVTLRDAGQVAVIDGDTYEVVNTVDSGYAVHITRMSATGRYAYVIGRDGRLALIDLWMEVPDKVAEVQLCYDARSVEVSKYNGEEGDFTDKYAIVGCYWPPHFAILDGQTLEPFKIVSTRSYTYDTEEYHPEPRVASILASHFKPEWIVNIKETGQVWLVNYTDPANPSIKMIEAERFLHDGGWDSTRRYFLVAANNSNRVAVIDALEGRLEALVDTAAIPHPGRGANWIDPEYGPVWSTSHLGDAGIVTIGTDPVDHSQFAWKAVRTTPLPGAGSLFLKTHPNSAWIWVDATLNPDPVLARTICVIAKADPSQTHKCWEAASYGRAVHFEYNQAGTQVWVSIWGDASQPGQTGEIVVYDDATLQEISRIEDLVTPTGKFNVYNTVNDIY
jgi:nitrite reductase (NO-forming)/hydroxylamine reductase